MNPVKVETFVGQKKCGHYTAKVAIHWKDGPPNEIQAHPEFCWHTEADALEAAVGIKDQFLQRLEALREVRNASPNSTKITETVGFFLGLFLGVLIGWHLFMFYLVTIP